MDTSTPIYAEYTPMAVWARILAWGATAGVGVAVLVAPPSEISFPVQVAVFLALLALGFAIDRFLGGLTVELYRTEVRLFLGRRGPIRKRVPLARIRELESVTYRPLKEFGGWGVRGFGSRQAWTARGTGAVVLHLDDGTALYVGSDAPARLEARIRTALETFGVGRRTSSQGGTPPESDVRESTPDTE
jgi:hypothetical protein